VEYAVLVAITVTAPYVLRFIMHRFDVDALCFITLFLFSYSLITMGYPLLGLLSLVQVTWMLIASLLNLS
jgi:hypothetical protein